MAIQTTDGWLLDVSHDYGSNNINLIIKLQDGKLISMTWMMQSMVLTLK
jgi:hypothetical protein